MAGFPLLDLSDSLGSLTPRRGLQLAIEGAAIGARGPAGVEFFGVPDSLGVAEAEAVARALSPYRIGPQEADSSDEPLLANPGLLELLGLPADPRAFDVAQAWRPRPIRDRLRVPIGVDELGQPVELDIKEAAQGGMGPHGLCVGATGSGKSEFLRTFVLGLMATHSSAMLNSELLAQKPEFIDLFVAIGRLGRSLQMHLLLASQRLEEGRLRGLESHLSYRVGLRTFSAAESRGVLGVPDAYELPPVPGLGFL